MKKMMIVLSLIVMAGINSQAQATNCVGIVVAACEALFPPDNTTLEDDMNNTTCQTEGIKILCSISGPATLDPGHLKNVVLKKRAQRAKVAAKRG